MSTMHKNERQIMMTEETVLAGYPSIDKLHNSFYRSKPVRVINAEQTIYEMVFACNSNSMNAPALEYLGVEWTYEKLKGETDKVARAFKESGLQKGDCVLLGVSNCPEAVSILLALNKLGAISRWFDVRASEIDIANYANDSNCKYLIIFDLLLPRITKVLDKTGLEKVLVIHPTDSLSKIMQMVYGVKANKSPKDERYERFPKFIKGNSKGEDFSCVSFDRNRQSIMIQSSGTTGKPKIIVHPDYSVTSSVKKLAYCDVPVEPGKVLLNALPPWIAYALGNAIIYPLTLGTKVKLCPSFDPNVVMDNIGTFTIAFAAPFHYRYIRDNITKLSRKQRNGLTKMECLVSGGDKITVEENEELEKILKTTLINGYGNNEGWGCITVNPVLHNKYGTVGIPKHGETVIAYDNDMEKELPYGECGEICALTDSLFLGYKGDEQATDLVKKVHSDGKMWLHTGDIGYIDEEGYVVLSGRARRVIVRQGFKISAYTIEDKVCEHPLVKECVAVEVKDEKEEHVPMAFVVLQEDATSEDAIQSINDKCKAELKEYEVPKHFQIVERLPYTSNGKYDFRLLEQMGNEYVDTLKK